MNESNFNYRMIFNLKSGKKYKDVFSKTIIKTAEMIHFSCDMAQQLVALQKTKVAKEEVSKN